MEEDWDLQAVVRGCATATVASAATTTTTATTSDAAALDLHRSSCFSPFGVVEQAHHHDGHLLCFPDPFETRREAFVEELHDLCRPFFPKSQPISPRTIPISSLSVLGGGFSDQTHQIQQQQKQDPPPSKHSHASSVASTTHSQSPRSKRRKNQMKKVCHIPAEGLSSDMWAWRKYGQKPIKGSPYPRGYYRCSSSKGCLARKQVERNRSDPDMFIVTYTAEHNHPMPTHRNSLAGSTRQKPVTPPAAATTTASADAVKPSAKPACSSPATSADDELVQQSTSVQSKDLVEDEEDDELGFSDTAVDDDFFMGLEELAEQVTGDCFPDHFPPSFPIPWLANNAATAAGGI
ncbi:hypothetical protein AAG906_027372 [Vitis piasezkii]